MRRDNKYASLEYLRTKRYRDTFAGKEARRWMRALSPAQRQWAKKHKLLTPHSDTKSSHMSLDHLPTDCYSCHVTEDLVESIMSAEEESQNSESHASRLHDLRLDLLRSFLMKGGHPRLNWLCLSYLAGQGGVLEEYAKQLGMSKQAFHYHVRKLEKLLDVHSSRQRSEKARNSHRKFNIRKHL